MPHIIAQTTRDQLLIRNYALVLKRFQHHGLLNMSSADFYTFEDLFRLRRENPRGRKPAVTRRAGKVDWAQ